jgi:hypothetical protein
MGAVQGWFSKIADYTFGMTRICIGCSLMAYYEDAYQLLRHGRYLSVVIHHHMGVTMELSAPMLRCGKVVSTGPPWMMMPSHLFDPTANVRGTEISIQGTQCH